MATAFSAIAGGPPSDPRSMAFIEWVVQDYLAYRLRWLVSPPTRSREIHVDPATGSDSNDGSAGNPVETLSQVHDILAAEPGSCEVIFAAGAVFRERGKDVTWLAGDGGHNAAIYVDRDDVTFRNADDENPPEFWCGNNRIATSAGWTLEGVVAGVYEIDVSGQPDVADGIGWIVDEASPTTVYTRAASVAAMNGVDRCFFYDGATTTLYVRVTGASPASQAWFLIPSNDLSCLRIEGDGVLVNLPGALWIGWGLDEAYTNSHDYAVSVGALAAEEVVVRPGTGLYGSSHIFATWHPGASSSSGGIVAFVGARGGLNQPGSGERLVNFFQPDGGQEALAVDCLADQPTLDGDTIQSVSGHTSAFAPVAWFLAWGCGHSGMEDLPTISTEADYVGFLIHSAPNENVFNGDSILFINPALSVIAGTGGFASSQNYIGTILNGSITLNGQASTLNRAGWFNASNPLLSTGRLDNCLINIVTKTGTSGLGTGIDFDVVTSDDTTTNITARSCVFQRAVGSTNRAAVGIGDNSDRQIDNGYFEIATSDVEIQNQAGYVNAANPLEMTERLVMGTATPAEMDGHATRQAEYDYYFRPRAASDAPGPIAAGELATASPLAGLPTILSTGDGILDARLNEMLVSSGTAAIRSVPSLGIGVGLSW